jgi:hypothetical protein
LYSIGFHRCTQAVENELIFIFRSLPEATGQAYTLGDADGLSLALTPQGGKSWHFRYYWQGAQKRMSLGIYPETSLREARQARDEARALLAKGVNPHTDRKQKRQAVRMAGENTFAAVFNDWIEWRKLEIQTGKRSTHATILRVFGKDILPHLGKRSILDLRRPTSWKSLPGSTPESLFHRAASARPSQADVPLRAR